MDGGTLVVMTSFTDFVQYLRCRSSKRSSPMPTSRVSRSSTAEGGRERLIVRSISGNSLNACSFICRLCPEAPCNTGQEQIVCTGFSLAPPNEFTICLATPPNTVSLFVSPTRTSSFRSSMPAFKVTSSSPLLALLSCHDMVLKGG